ncbi:PilZ domain-containing protein [Neobacillus sp. LXY-4]|uniref:PilZ domain-containing protein n=1 Tax=Neobacillus sp. LXY-4 TaxID=3379826 RepID=UPI003EE288DF
MSLKTLTLNNIERLNESMEGITEGRKTVIRVGENSQNEDKQNFLRINVRNPIVSEMTLINMDDIEIGKTELVLENIGPGGLRFLSNLNLLVHQKVIYSFEPAFLGEKIHLFGEIIWSYELPDGMYQYGVHFTLPEDRRVFLSELLNDYSKRYF